MRRARKALISFGFVLATAIARGGVLPEERADALYHYYSGGGVEVDGPSILVRKNIGKSVSLSGNYYVDTVSSASIDVLSQASRYSEQRTEFSVGADLLHADTMMNLSYSQSDEPDYKSHTYNVGISQEVFGGLTTISLGYGRGYDDVLRRGAPGFKQPAEHWRYRLGVSQVVTRNLLVGMSFEAIADEGYLQNPYRQARYVDPTDTVRGFSFEPEIYPRTRNATAVSLRARYYLPYRAAVHADYRFFSDSWAIRAHTAEIGYTHPWKRWTFEGSYRYYTQGNADFYSDLFPYANSQNFLARDRELASFTSHNVRLGAAYEFPLTIWGFGQKGSVNLSWDHILYGYDDFRNNLAGGPAGSEPLYDYSADVIQFFFSFFF
jgi:opacity protein-like surface antigen